MAKSFATPTVAPEAAPPPPVEAAATTTNESPAERDKNIVTTVEETRCFEMIAGWIHEVHHDATVVPKDSQSYFAVNQGNVRTWFIRFNVQTAPYWIAFRHISPDDLKTLAPGADLISVAGFGDSRASLGGLQDVPKFRTAVLTAFTRQAASKPGHEPEQGSSPLTT